MKITGKDLIEMGYRDGKWFGAALEYINKEGLQGKALVAFLNKAMPREIDPLEFPQSYYKNIAAGTDLDEANVSAVIASMDEVMKTPTITTGAIMPDACPTGQKGQIPVGCIAVAKNAIHPAMHSADICCSVMMSSFGFVDPRRVLDAAHEMTHFGPGGREEFCDLPHDLNDRIRSNDFLSAKASISLAREHLGTQGDGNHFLYVGQSEQTGETIMVTHHGSRGFGAHLYKQGMKAAELMRQEVSPKTLKINAWLPYESEKGKEYWEALLLVREWTKLNHEVLHDATAYELKKDVQDRFWNEHNFVFKEGDLFYHAKGATPLDNKFLPDAVSGLRLIPLNMREPVLIVKGSTTQTNLGFAPHGAGRNISRSQHRRENADRTDEEIFETETQGLDVRFYSGHIDITELPSAYKNADIVQDQMEQFGLGDVVDRIIPYGCIMAGDWQKNAPWRKRKKS